MTLMYNKRKRVLEEDFFALTLL